MLADSPKNVKEAMQSLSLNMQAVVNAAMLNDYGQIYKLAEKIENHEGPPIKHRLALLAELKLDIANFKSFDDKVRANAIAMKEAAQNQNMKLILKEFGKITEECINCHAIYRERIRRLNLN